MAAAVASVIPQHPAGFLLNNNHQQSYQDPVPSVQPTVPAVPKTQPADPYYGHEETARICARFIRHVFNCPSEGAPTALPPNSKPTETTISLPRFIAYAFHRTRLPTCVAYHALFLLSRLKARYPAASCAFGHRLFLTSYMLSSKVICDDTYSNKSWAIVGQGFYELRDVNLMEREMIHYLSFDLTIPSAELEKFTQHVRSTYKRGVPKTSYVVIPDKSRENDYFGKGTLEIDSKPLGAVLSKKAHIEVPVFAPPPIAPLAIPVHTVPASSPANDDSPYTDSLSNSSRTSSPPSPYLKTPPDDATAIGFPGRSTTAKHHIRAHFGDVRDASIRIGTDSNYASPSGW